MSHPVYFLSILSSQAQETEGRSKMKDKNSVYVVNEAEEQWTDCMTIHHCNPWYRIPSSTRIAQQNHHSKLELS